MVVEEEEGGTTTVVYRRSVGCWWESRAPSDGTHLGDAGCWFRAGGEGEGRKIEGLAVAIVVAYAYFELKATDC
jgi:hypothetical protein